MIFINLGSALEIWNLALACYRGSYSTADQRDGGADGGGADGGGIRIGGREKALLHPQE